MYWWRVRKLLRELKSDDYHKRLQAAKALEESRVGGHQVVAALAEFHLRELKGDDYSKRVKAAHALSELWQALEESRGGYRVVVALAEVYMEMWDHAHKARDENVPFDKHCDGQCLRLRVATVNALARVKSRADMYGDNGTVELITKLFG